MLKKTPSRVTIENYIPGLPCNIDDKVDWMIAFAYPNTVPIQKTTPSFKIGVLTLYFDIFLWFFWFITIGISFLGN
jgi:hypothetical protein